jgi:hypothetical protein
MTKKMCIMHKFLGIMIKARPNRERPCHYCLQLCPSSSRSLNTSFQIFIHYSQAERKICRCLRATAVIKIIKILINFHIRIKRIYSVA